MTEVRSATVTPTNRAALLIPLLIDFGVPLIVFYGLRAAGVDQWWSLLLSGVVPVIAVIVRFVRSRRVDFLAVFVLSVVAFVLAKVGPDGLRAWESKWDTDRRFRHGLRVLTFVWGCVGLLNVLVTLAAAYLLPLDLATGVLNVSWPVLVAPTLLFHLYYTKKWDLRA